MDYLKIYKDLINKRKLNKYIKTRFFYVEQHHIIPKCMNGTDDADNLVYLTPREHYIAHALLYKIYKSSKFGREICHAFCCMCDTSNTLNRHIKYNSRIYENARNKLYSSNYYSDSGKHSVEVFLEKIYRDPIQKERWRQKIIKGIKKRNNRDIIEDIKNRNRERKINICYMMWNWYHKYGFESMKKQFGYSKTQQAFCQMMRIYVKNYSTTKMQGSQKFRSK